MKDCYRNSEYRGYELEWIYLRIHMAQTNVRQQGMLQRSFLTVEAARRWIEEKTKPLTCGSD